MYIAIFLLNFFIILLFFIYFYPFIYFSTFFIYTIRNDTKGTDATLGNVPNVSNFLRL